MKGIFFAMVMTLFCACSASAQSYVVPGGAVWPDGGIGYVVPAGAPFDVRTYESLTYPYSPYASPVYPIPSSYIMVPMGDRSAWHTIETPHCRVGKSESRSPRDSHWSLCKAASGRMC